MAEEHHEHFLILVALMKSDEPLNVWGVYRENKAWADFERVKRNIARLCKAGYIMVANENDASPRYSITIPGEQHYKDLIRRIQAQGQEVKLLGSVHILFNISTVNPRATKERYEVSSLS